MSFSTPVRSSITYQPALDGVRALAVVAVLLFHAEVPGFDGGYLGVSVFFTLSGYLITSLLVSEHDRAGRIDLARFYGRRVRRLMPASAVCLGAIVVLAALSDVFDGVADLRRQIVGSILQVANWVFLAGEGSYQELFQDTGGATSPVEHFWSLAIEEQFYWVWPPVMLAVLGSARSRRARTAVVGAITAVFVAAAPVIAVVWGPDAAYWATPARIGEILIGAVLATVLHGRDADARLAPLAPVALTVLAACVVLFPPTSGPAYEGWLPAVAVVSAALVTGVQADGPVRRALSFPPLVWLGTISYGVYLYHWPVFVVADADRVGFDGPLLVVVQLALTLGISVVSFYALERPIRHAHRMPHPLTFGGAALATAAVVVVALVVVPSAGDYWEVDDVTADAAAIQITGEPLDDLVVTTKPAPTTLGPTTSSPTTSSPIAAEPAAEEPTTTTANTITPTTTTHHHDHHHHDHHDHDRATAPGVRAARADRRRG
jgi:peptidoglycan/LPS O-acetylase OafA/YrhL